MINHDLPCSKCGYNLRYAQRAGICPECAQPVRISFREWKCFGAGGRRDFVTGCFACNLAAIYVPSLQIVILLDHLRITERLKLCAISPLFLPVLFVMDLFKMRIPFWWLEKLVPLAALAIVLLATRCAVRLREGLGPSWRVPAFIALAQTVQVLVMLELYRRHM